MKPAVFLDRDGTLINLVHHLTSPEHVRLKPKAGDSLRRLREQGYACVLVTNQSVIGRGLLTEAGLNEIQAELERQLRTFGASLDAWYFCPIEPKQPDPTFIEHPDRKPGPGMLLKAAAEHGLDLGRSWMIGDTISDMLAGRHAGCRGTILVRTGYGTKVKDAVGAVDHTVDDIFAAAELIAELDAAGPKSE